MSDKPNFWDRLRAAQDAYQQAGPSDDTPPTPDERSDTPGSRATGGSDPSGPPPGTPPAHDELPPKRKWYEKKRYLIPLALLVLFVYIGATADDTGDTQEAAAGAGESVADEPEPEPEPPEEEAEEPPPDPVVEEEPEPEPEPAAEEEVEPEPEPEPAPRPKFRRTDYQDLTSREFAKIVRDPDAHIGEQVWVFGEVTQFDAATGPDQFRASVDGDLDPAEYDIVLYEHNAVFVGKSARQLEDVVTGDHIRVFATVQGSIDYETQIGGSTTAPVFSVDRIKVLGQVD